MADIKSHTPNVGQWWLQPVQRTAKSRSRRALISSLVIVISVHLLGLLSAVQLANASRNPILVVKQCTLDRLHRKTSFLDNTRPITTGEFIERRDKLAKALHASGADAFVLEPGYTFQYYGNVSQTDWEPWEPEERPFLMVVRPVEDGSTSAIVAETSYLAPHFEETRVRMLDIPSEGELDIVTWEEHWNPYETMKHDLFKGEHNITLMIDEELRDYIVRGLSDAGFKTAGLSTEVEAVRQTKSHAEVDLLRAVNTGTVEALRAMRPCRFLALFALNIHH